MIPIDILVTPPPRHSSPANTGVRRQGEAAVAGICMRMACRSVCEGLLQKVVSNRLGCSSGRHGVREVKIHPWFNTINWRRMEAGRISPPFEPDPHAVYAKVMTVLCSWLY